MGGIPIGLDARVARRDSHRIMQTPDDTTAESPDSAPAARRRLGRGQVVVILIAALTLVGLIGFYLVIPFPWTLRTRNPDMTSLMQQRVQEGRRAGQPLEIKHDWIALDDVSPGLIRAVIVAEDDRFREHTGVDWLALADEVEWTGDDSFSWWSGEDRAALREAFRYVGEHRDDIRGRSTITQQLAKNLYFGLDRSMLRKAMEVVVAGRLERRLGKDRVLELYLNIVEHGPGIFGVEAAAQEYFGRSASSLSLFQAASLAATLPHPLSSNPATNPGRMAWRRDLILRRLNAAPGSAPIPIPPPILELPAGADAIGDGLSDSGIPTVDTDTFGVLADTLGVDTLGVDTLGVDTLRVDTLGVGGLGRGAGGDGHRAEPAMDLLGVAPTFASWRGGGAGVGPEPPGTPSNRCSDARSLTRNYPTLNLVFQQLPSEESGIHTVCRNQFVMPAALNQAPVLKHQDQVGPHYGAHSV